MSQQLYGSSSQGDTQIEVEEDSSNMIPSSVIHPEKISVVPAAAARIDDDDEDDDWNPLPVCKENSIISKVKVKFTNKEIKIQGEEGFRDVRFDQGEFAEYDEGEVDEDDFEEPSEGKKGRKKRGEDNEIDNEAEDFCDDEDFEVDKGNAMFYDNKAAIRKLREQIVSEDIFFNPIEDEEDDKWAASNLKQVMPNTSAHGKKVVSSGNCVLSCPCCFVQVCYDSERHTIYENQYRSQVAKNVRVNTTKVIEPICDEDDEDEIQGKNRKSKGMQNARSMNGGGGEAGNAKFRRKKRKNKNNKNDGGQQMMQGQQELKILETDDLRNVNLEELEAKLENQREKFLIYFSAECVFCDTEVAAYEVNEKTYHFFNVIPSLA